jgi:hypothetical protein
MMAVSCDSVSWPCTQRGDELALQPVCAPCLECAAEPVRAPRGANLASARTLPEVR